MNQHDYDEIARRVVEALRADLVRMYGQQPMTQALATEITPAMAHRIRTMARNDLAESMSRKAARNARKI